MGGTASIVGAAASRGPLRRPRVTPQCVAHRARPQRGGPLQSRQRQPADEARPRRWHCWLHPDVQRRPRREGVPGLRHRRARPVPARTGPRAGASGAPRWARSHLAVALARAGESTVRRSTGFAACSARGRRGSRKSGGVPGSVACRRRTSGNGSLPRAALGSYSLTKIEMHQQLGAWGEGTMENAIAHHYGSRATWEGNLFALNMTPFMRAEMGLIELSMEAGVLQTQAAAQMTRLAAGVEAGLARLSAWASMNRWSLQRGGLLLGGDGSCC